MCHEDTSSAFFGFGIGRRRITDRDGAKLVSAVVAVPLKASAAVGDLSGEMGDAFWEVANAPVVDPLPITEDVVTIDPPPAEALTRTSSRDAPSRDESAEIDQGR